MSTDRIQSNPEIAKHLAFAFVRALNYINSHTPEQTLELIPTSITGKDRQAYLQVLKQEYGMFLGNGCMQVAAAQQELDALKRFNSKFKDVHVDNTYSNEFVKIFTSCQ